MILFRIFDSLYFSARIEVSDDPPCVFLSRFFSAVALVLRFFFFDMYGSSDHCRVDVLIALASTDNDQVR